MHSLKLNLTGSIVFIVISLFGFIIDVINGMGGGGRISAGLLLIASILSLILFFKGTYEGLLALNPNLMKMLLLIFSIMLGCLQLLVSYIFSTIIALYILAPIMIKLGYYVTMP